MKRRYCTRSATSLSVDETPPIAKKSRQSVDTRKKKFSGKDNADIVVKPPNSQNKKRISSGLVTSSHDKIQQTQINDLPVPIMVKIFEYLNLPERIKIERVCRRWNAIGRNSAWVHTRKLDYSVITCDSTENDKDAFVVEDEFISRRSLGNWYYKGLYGMYIKHSRPQLSNNSVRQLLDRSGAYLRSIDLAGYRDRVDYHILRFISRQCPRLESLNFTGILVTNSSLRSLASGCPRLKSVTFQRSFHDCIVDPGLSSLFINCCGLTALNLCENERLSGRCFADIPATVKQLELSGCYGLDDEAIRAVAERCPSLEVLYLDCCDNISSDSLAFAFDRLSELRILRLSEFHIFTMQAASAGVIQAMRSLGKLSNLTELFMNNNHLIDDSVIAAIARGCPLLEKLDISGSNNSFTDASLISLSQFSFRTLKRLNISHLTRITNAGVLALGKCVQLTTLIMHRCGMISDDGMIELAKNCSLLHHLDVSNCIWITNKTVRAFCKERQRQSYKLRAEKRKQTMSRRKGSATVVKEDSSAMEKTGNLADLTLTISVGGTMVSITNPKYPKVKLNYWDEENHLWLHNGNNWM